jgi:putative hydrolase of the HAD superfamily
MMQMKLPKAILFDLDDTLISFDGVSRGAWEDSCQEFVSERPRAYTREALLDSVYAASRWYWGDPARHKTGRENLPAARREVVSLALSKLEETDPRAGDALADRYTLLQDARIHLFPDTLPTLDALKAAGVRLALITNGSSIGQRAKLTRFGLTDSFEFILIDQELGFGKPDVRVYEHALSLLGLEARDVWMVGDNPVWDIWPPMTIGITAVWHDWRKKGLEPGETRRPDRTITGIGELLIP